MICREGLPLPLIFLYNGACYNGAMTDFPKGHIPWNKGKKQPYSKETLQAMREAKLRNPTRYWLGKKRPETRYWLNKKRSDISNENNYAWKGEQAGYHAKHGWIRRKLGSPIKCEHCGSVKNLHWANKDHKYKRKLTDWIALCAKCHKAYDKK